MSREAREVREEEEAEILFFPFALFASFARPSQFRLRHIRERRIVLPLLPPIL
jgi:hypothetical protein